jgi:peptidyl-tRNA hydrolase, PTH1 family
MTDRWLIAGLGNPGPQYAGHRHNAGFMVAEVLAARMGVTLRRDRSGAAVATGLLAGVPVTLARPLTFMNLSGRPVAALRAFYKIPPERVLILHDELDLPFGTVRLKLGGGDNGHNGLRSVTAALGGPGYHRTRIGIGRPPGRMDPAVFVLRDFSPAERQDLPLVLDLAADASEALLRAGLAAAQNEFHRGI